jgi:hypothetical protein
LICGKVASSRRCTPDEGDSPHGSARPCLRIPRRIDRESGWLPVWQASPGFGVIKFSRTDRRALGAGYLPACGSRRLMGRWCEFS